MAPAHPRGPDDPSSLRFLLDVLDSEDRVERLIKLITVVGKFVVVTVLIVGATVSVIYLSTQHLPLWSKIATSGGAALLSVLYGVRRSRLKRSSGARSLGKRRSAGELPQRPEGGEHPPGDSGEE